MGSVIHIARGGDIIWGSGFRDMPPADFMAGETLDVRAVRGPLSREILLNAGIECPPVYSDPAMLLPRLFPELEPEPVERDYVVAPNCGEMACFDRYVHTVMPGEPWRRVVTAMRQSRLVISGSVHGLIVAEAFGIPARMLRMTTTEPLFKYEDYYRATGRPSAVFATSVGEAIEMGGQQPARLDLQPLIDSFPGLPMEANAHRLRDARLAGLASRPTRCGTIARDEGNRIDCTRY